MTSASIFLHFFITVNLHVFLFFYNRHQKIANEETGKIANEETGQAFIHPGNDNLAYEEIGEGQIIDADEKTGEAVKIKEKKKNRMSFFKIKSPFKPRGPKPQACTIIERYILTKVFQYLNTYLT